MKWQEEHKVESSFTMQKFDILSTESLPKCDFLIMSDIMYYNDLALASARRAADAMYGGAEVLVTDPGRSTQTVFIDELRRITSKNVVTTASKSSVTITPENDRRTTMIEVWAKAARFLPVTVSKDGGKSFDCSGNYMWL